MPEYKIIVTWEAIYDMADIMDYIEADFGEERADRFQLDIKRELEKLSYTAVSFLKRKSYTEDMRYIRNYFLLYYLLYREGAKTGSAYFKSN
ncbi:MAG: type II toxin-antitoxin system RelE/ParE family toxin [Eisenbergiella sp.]